MERRNAVLALLALGVAPLARAQAPALPVVGYLSNSSPGASSHLLASLRRGLNEAGYADGRNVAIEYRFSDGRTDELPRFVADFVKRRATVIVATGGATTWRPAKGGAASIPIVFVGGGDPVKLGLVASLGRPGGNATGVTTNSSGLGPKRLQLLRELAPSAAMVSVLVNILTDLAADEFVKEVQALARTGAQKIQVVNVRSERDFDAAFADIGRHRAGALLVSSSPYLLGHRAQVVALAAKYSIPASYAFPEFVDAGGLMSYGVNLSETYRNAGVYAGRILGGTKPADLPVLQPTVFELAINLKTAKALGIKVPQSLLVRADRVIE